MSTLEKKIENSYNSELGALLDKVAEERYGEFGFDTCSYEEKLEIIASTLK